MNADLVRQDENRPRLRKADRRERILLELRLRPHVRVLDLAASFDVSTETIRRDLQDLSDDGLIARAHGGASAPVYGEYPGIDERNRSRLSERESIGREAALLVNRGETVMLDSGSTTLQFARFLSFAGTPCTIITNSISAARALSSCSDIEIIMCPGDVSAAEQAVTGTDTIEYLLRHRVDRCVIGAYGLTADGPSEMVRGFAAVKRAMLKASGSAHLLIDSGKFGRLGLSVIGAMSEFASIVVDMRPGDEIGRAIRASGATLQVAPAANTRDFLNPPGETGPRAQRPTQEETVT